MDFQEGARSADRIGKGAEGAGTGTANFRGPLPPQFFKGMETSKASFVKGDLQEDKRENNIQSIVCNGKNSDDNMDINNDKSINNNNKIKPYFIEVQKCNFTAEDLRKNVSNGFNKEGFKNINNIKECLNINCFNNINNTQETIMNKQINEKTIDTIKNIKNIKENEIEHTIKVINKKQTEQQNINNNQKQIQKKKKAITPLILMVEESRNPAEINGWIEEEKSSEKTELINEAAAAEIKTKGKAIVATVEI